MRRPRYADHEDWFGPYVWTSDLCVLGACHACLGDGCACECHVEADPAEAENEEVTR